MSIISFDSNPTPPPAPKPPRVGYDFGTREFVIYIEDHEVGRLSQEHSAQLIEEITSSRIMS